MIYTIAIVTFICLGVVYFFLRQAICKHNIIRYDTDTESLTDVYEGGKLVLRMNHNIN